MYKSISEKFLFQEFIDKERSIEEIAKSTGCCKATIIRYLKKFNIKAENRKSRIRPNQIYGKLITLKKIKVNKNRHTIWLCKCECGNTKEIIGIHLKSGKTISCGCRLKQNGSKNYLWKGYKDISGSIWYRINNGAKKRNLEFNITIEQAWKIFIQQNQKCALTGISISFQKNNRTASLDRIDSKKGYTVDNIWWIHKDINKMKWNYDLDYFLKMCQLISKYKAPGETE